MKRTTILLFSAIVFLFTPDIFGQMDHRYIGLHYEYGATLNMRYGRISGKTGHYIVEAAWPRLITGLSGWRVDENVQPVKHGRYFSMRGGKHFSTGEKSSLGFDILWEFTGVATPPDSGSEKTFTGYMTMPLGIGIVYNQTIGENFNMMIMPNWGYACTKTRNNDGKQHQRISADLYLALKATDAVTFYGGAAYVYYPKGLPTTWPYDKPFGGPQLSIGIAFTTGI